MIINRGKRARVCVRAPFKKPPPLQLRAPNLKLLGEEKKGGLQYCNVPGGKINGQLIDVSVGVRL